MPWAGRGVIGQWRRAVSIGEVLASARSQAGLTITQVSQRTRIRATIIGGIERDDFSGCGGDFYARGHIRAIARAVGADGEPLVGEYDSSHGTPQASTGAGIPGPLAPLRLRQRRRPNWSVALLAALAAAASVVTYHLVASGPTGGAPAAARTPAVSVHKAARTHPAAANTAAPPGRIGLHEIDRRQVGPPHPGGGLRGLVISPQDRRLLGRDDRKWGGLRCGGVSATRSAVAAMSAAAAARCAGPILAVTTVAQPGWVASRRQASWTVSAALASAAGPASPAPSIRSAPVSWAARRAGLPPTAGTALTGAAVPAAGRGRDGGRVM
jgi:Helix-turn-helix domain